VEVPAGGQIVRPLTFVHSTMYPPNHPFCIIARDKTVLNYHDANLKQSDVDLLKEGNWINDNLIFFWFEYLEYERFDKFSEKLSLIGPPVVHIMKSAFSNLGQAQEATMILESMQLGGKRLILFPINNQNTEAMNIGGTHWTLLAYIASSNTFVHFDSLGKSDNKNHAQRVATFLSEYILKNTDATVIDGECTAQKNGYDCGIHVIENAEALCINHLEEANDTVLKIAEGIIAEKKIKTRQRLIELVKSKSSNKPA